jgi:uncharacterized protein YwqG
VTALHPEVSRVLDARIAAQGLERVSALIHQRAAPCYAVVVQSAEDYARVGNSRLGGLPDLPVEVAWPTAMNVTDRRKTCSAAFLGQINFAELPPLGSPSPLPATGLLQVFVPYIESAGEPVPVSPVFSPGNAALRRRSPPRGSVLCDEYLDGLTPVRVRFVPWVSLPHYDHNFAEEVEGGVGGGPEACLRRIDLAQSLRHPGQIGQVLGYANAGDENQNLYRQISLTRMGQRARMYADHWDSMEAYEHTLTESAGTPFLESQQQMRPGVEWLMAHRDEIAAEAAEWRLLLQVDSNQEMNLMINDADPLYVFIRDADLARSDFGDLAGEVTQG